MVSIDTKTNRFGSGCLMLFALPFAAVGVGVVRVERLDAARLARRPPAGLRCRPKSSPSSSRSTRTTKAARRTRRRPRIATTTPARHYTGTRVAIDTGADNIGGFQHRLYYDLNAAHERGTPVTAYVDPDEPTRAVLNRELRPGLFALKGIFALVFGGVGFGLLFGARYAAKKMAAEEKLEQRFPDEPWRWRPEWANGRIAGSARAAAYVAIAFAVLWNLISLPAALLVPGEIASGNTIAAVALLFPLIGLGLAAWAIRAWLQLQALQSRDVGSATHARRARRPAQGPDSRRIRGADRGRLRPRARVLRDGHERQRQEPQHRREAAVAEAVARAAASMPDRRRSRRFPSTPSCPSGSLRRRWMTATARSHGASKSSASAPAPISGANSSCPSSRPRKRRSAAETPAAARARRTARHSQRSRHSASTTNARRKAPKRGRFAAATTQA